MNNKEWTGERLETFVYTENTVEHLHRYAVACSLSNNLDVLDIASGEGYGSNLLARVAKKVTGVDISKETVDLAKKKYKKSNLVFKEGSASEIPMPDHSVDIVVSFETIEHHDQHKKMLSEIKRVLRPGGALLMSSPDKENYTNIRNHKNDFHIKELYFLEFKELIRTHFSKADFFLQKVVAGSLIIHENHPQDFAEYKGDYEDVQNESNFRGVYNLCMASDGVLPVVPTSFFDGKYVDKIILGNVVKSAENGVKSSLTYRIGNFLLLPIKFFKK